jgi:WD40 repeat protein/tRNA A-37 threonylcarbamoyl transferase component Bud32
MPRRAHFGHQACAKLRTAQRSGFGAVPDGACRSGTACVSAIEAMAGPPKVDPPTDRTEEFDDTVQREVEHAPKRANPRSVTTVAPGDRITGQEPLPDVDPDHYDLGSEFARGGLGRILRGRDRRLRRIVAIKELLSKDDKAETRFVREAFITARLEHPNIVPVHEAGMWPSGKRFYAMKLVEGRTLAEALDAANTREERLALLPHVIDVADAVAYAHSQGILHRDLKPGNVMVGAFGETVVIDWGLAKDLWASEPDSYADRPAPTDSLMTSDGIVVGTPPYMPPEQASARTVDERADVYALGAMLYHVLCGRRPYQDVRSKDVLLAVVSGPPKALRELVPDCPVDLVAIAEKAMARDPDQRYPSAREMAEELRRYSTGQLVGAHQYSPGELAMRFVRRNAAAFTIATAAAVFLAGFGAWSFNNIRHARDEARRQADEAMESNDQLLLEKARRLLDEDPTRSLGVLKALSRKGREGASSVAARAEELGVARYIEPIGVPLDAVAVSADGRWAAAGARSGGIRLLDLRDGSSRDLEGHSDRVTALAFSADGSRLVSASYDDTLRTWFFDGRPPLVLEGHQGDVKDFTFLPQGGLASVSTDGSVRWWNRRGELTGTGRFESAVRQLRVAAAGPTVATGGHGPWVQVWPGPEASPRPLRCDATEAMAFALSTDGSRLVCGGASGAVWLHDLRSGSQRSLRKGASPTLSVDWSQRHVVSTHFDGTVVLYDLDSGEETRLEEHDERVNLGLFLGAEKRSLVTAAWDHEIRVTDLRGRTQRILRGHSDTVAGLGFDRGGRWLASASWDGSLRVWSLRPQERLRLSGHRVGVHGVDYDPTGRYVASGGHDDEVRVWDLSDGSVRVFEGHEDHVFRVRFSPDGRRVASSSDDQTVRLWDLEEGRHRVLRGHTADVEELSFSPDQRWLASAGEDDLVWLWSLTDEASRPLRGHTDFVTGVAFQGKYLFSSGRDGAVWRWEPNAPARPGERWIEFEGPVSSLALDPDGNEMAVALESGLAIVDLEAREVVFRQPMEGARIVAWSPDRSFVAAADASSHIWLCTRSYADCNPLPNHRGPVLAMTFSPDSKVLATASADTTIRLWDTRTGEYRALAGHSLQVFDLAFGPDGGSIVSGSADTEVRVWPVSLPPTPSELTSWLNAQTAYDGEG